MVWIGLTKNYQENGAKFKNILNFVTYDRQKGLSFKQNGLNFKLQFLFKMKSNKMLQFVSL